MSIGSPVSAYVSVCERKVPYFTYGAAFQAAQSLFARTGEIVYPYRCGICILWHNGHPPDSRDLGEAGNWTIPAAPPHETHSTAEERARRDEQAKHLSAAQKRERGEAEAERAAEQHRKKAALTECYAARREQNRFMRLALQRFEDDGGPAF